ncbi:hypothetical protein BHE74_00055498 [Ensete ventricosum]|nr:hypothetical protein BHE74_00055498 [Ensete ventricosum]
MEGEYGQNHVSAVWWNQRIVSDRRGKKSDVEEQVGFCCRRSDGDPMGGCQPRCLRRRFGRLIAESMVGSDRDRQRSRDLMRGTSRASRLSPAKRQPIGFSSPTVSNDNVHSNSGDGVDTNASMARWKDKVRTSRWRLNNNDSSGEVGCSRSEGEEANPIGAMLGSITTATLTSRKTVGLHEKV